jgi:universal stress protein E
MKRILVASDLSQRSRRALRRAMALTRQFGWELSILYVADDDRPGALIAEECRGAEEALHELVEKLGAPSPPSAPSVITRVGDPFRVIVDEANAVQADLIVMGAHRKRLLGDVFTGTTIERVMRLGGRPVLMVNADSEAPYAKVAAAVDLSEASANALRTARKLGLLEPSSTAAVHAFTPIAEGHMHYAGIEGELIAEHVAASAREARSAVAGFLADDGLGDIATVIVERGAPFEVIQDAVKKMRTDLLVIGTRGYGGLKRILLGSVADQVLRGIGCDILAVPPRERAS